MRPILEHLFRMQRPLMFRLSTASAVLVFMTMGGVTGVESHPLSPHGPHSGVTDAGPRSDSEMHHAGHHSRHPQHGSSQDCTCIGACVGGAAPTLTNALLFEIPGGEIDLLRVVRATVLLIRQDPTSYLFPLPNAPPLQA